ncbi:MAG: hypothetical protein JNK05_15720 [Myxococcales bacterium]|nr:hypothetical protein [Myxococcales bacterium]
MSVTTAVSRLAWSPLAIAMLSAVASCAPRPATAVVLRFSTDVDAARIRRVTLALRWDEPGATDFATREYIIGGGTAGLRFPGTVVVAPVDARASALTSRALRVESTMFVANADGTTRSYVTARALVRLTEERTVSVDLAFADLCGSSATSARCTSAESCAVFGGEARCAPLVVQERLPDYTPDASLTARE